MVGEWKEGNGRSFRGILPGKKGPVSCKTGGAGRGLIPENLGVPGRGQKKKKQRA